MPSTITISDPGANNVPNFPFVTISGTYGGVANPVIQVTVTDEGDTNIIFMYTAQILDATNWKVFGPPIANTNPPQHMPLAEPQPGHTYTIQAAIIQPADQAVKFSRTGIKKPAAGGSGAPGAVAVGPSTTKATA